MNLKLNNYTCIDAELLSNSLDKEGWDMKDDEYFFDLNSHAIKLNQSLNQPPIDRVQTRTKSIFRIIQCYGPHLLQLNSP